MLAIVNVIYVCTSSSGTVYAVATQFCRHTGTLFINIVINYETAKTETHFLLYFSVDTFFYKFHTQNNVSPLRINFGSSETISSF